MNRLEVAPVGYEEDFVLWIEHQVSLLRTAQFEQLDIDNLVEELEGIMRSERRELANRLKVVTMHLLKCQFQPHRKSRSWLRTLSEQRSRIEMLIEDSPSLRPAVLQSAQKVYPHAIREAHDQTRVPVSAFPASLPYSDEQLLDFDFVP